jgi:16S rRNA (guanine(966)-N(2))-methyltransferase RsmD
MLDRVREALFSILQGRVEDARVLDLFAGSGSLGLEALSRGAGSARFVERDRRALALLQRNVAELGLEQRVRLVGGDALAAASWGGEADLVFLDPPYPLLRGGETRGRVFEAVRQLGREVLAPDGIAVLHAPRREVRALEFGDELTSEARDYGTSSLWLLERSDAP